MTKITIIPGADKINHRHKVLMLGSCFAENIGSYLCDLHFRCDVNPFGVLYNPISIAEAIKRLSVVRPFQEQEIVFSGNLYHSYMHHSKFSKIEKNEVLQSINRRLCEGAEQLHACDYLLITFGTSYVYKLRATGQVVANCHKQPEKEFIRERISCDDIVAEWKDLILSLTEVNPRLKIIFTVSPIRHLRDGAHENQLSKATLLLAIDYLCRNFSQCLYFPAYEIVMDELRDYRFYDTDMTHPSKQTIEYIREKFADSFFDKETTEINRFWTKFSKAIHHRPLTADKSAYKDFIMQNLFKLEEFHQKYPFFDITNEVKILQQHLHEI